MTYQESKEMVKFMTTYLIEMYFDDVEMKKTCAKEALYDCPNFIKKVWKQMIDHHLEVHGVKINKGK